MNKLDDMMTHYDVTNSGVIPDESLNAEEKNRILSKTIEKAGLTAAPRQNKDAAPQSTARTGRTRHRLWPAAVACVLVMALATISFASIALDKNFFDFFHADRQEQKDILGSIGTLIDKQVSDRDLTIDVREAVGDGNTVNVLFNIIAPEGTRLDQSYYSFSSALVDLPKDPAGGAGYYFEMLPDDNPADNKLTMMLCYNADKNLSGNTMRFRFTDLTTPKNAEEIDAIDALPPREEPGTPGDEYDFNKTVAAGNWEIEFPLNYSDASTTIKPNAAIQLYGGECKIKELRYSPISVSMTIKGHSIAKFDSMPPNLPDGRENMLTEENNDSADISAGAAVGEIEVKLKDGTIVSTNGTGTSIDGDTLMVTCSFTELINPTNIASVSYNGVTIQLP